MAAFREWAPLVCYSESSGRERPIIRPGAVRRLGVYNAASVDEEIVEARPPHYQRYIGVRGFPVSQYRGEIDLSQVETGTELLWTVTFEQLAPGTGRPIQMIIRGVITYLVDHAISAAEHAT